VRLLNGDKALAQQPQATSGPDQNPITLRVPANLKRCGGEIRLIISGPAVNTQRQQPAPSLIKAISRSHEWIRRLEAGEFKDQRALAAAIGLAPRHVRFILRTAFVAPEIVEAILEGRQPPTLMLASLMGDLPLSWREQKKTIGLT
jgi:site-specific DNA recombinase